MSALEPLPHPPSSLATLRAAIVSLDDQRAALHHAGDLDSLAHGLHQLDMLIGDLRQIRSAVVADVADLMPDKRVEIPGLGVIERRKGTERRQWQSADLLARLVRDAIDPDRTGELPDAGHVLEAVMETVTSCLPITGSVGWRVTALRARGIDPDEWAECTPAKPSVQIHADAKGA